jgi:hypothetical protein
VGALHGRKGFFPTRDPALVIPDEEDVSLLLGEINFFTPGTADFSPSGALRE